MRRFRWSTVAAVIAVILCNPAHPQDAAKDAVPPVPETMDMAQVIALLQQQQKELAEQRELLDGQAIKITELTHELDALRAPPVVETAPVVASTAPEQPTTEPKTTPAASLDGQVADGAPAQKTKEEIQIEDEIAVATAQADDPAQELLSSFPGAWRLPGTESAFKVGGYVRAAVVLNKDVLAIQDRFIVGSIPVGPSPGDDNAAQSSITADQSRLNFDYREHTSAGILRAFIEGDFTSNNNTFRLRHAFGQWDRVLAGQTWSAFVDPAATPEGVDFEGLNGRINVRQSQVRYSPRIGEDFEFRLSLEDPNPQIQNGSGVTRIPDVVLAGNFQPNERLHVRAALLGRQIRGQPDIPGETGEQGGVDKRYAWGFSISGSFTTPRLDSRDKFLFQINRGDGIGRYVNDLSSTGSYDGIFNQDTGKLQLFTVSAGYGSWQHWWANTMRSNFTLGYVAIDNPEFIDSDAYKRTIRASANIIWNPTQHVDTGVEYLWGRRQNKDGEKGDAQQVQMMIRYIF
jgi:hypothetical protein